MNLARQVGDDPAAVVANRAALSAWFGVPIVFGRQVHGTRVQLVEDPHLFEDPHPFEEVDGDGCDALVSRRSDLGLGVLVADCVPILLADSRARVVGTAHAGRTGLLGGVVQQVVRAMVGLGASPAAVRAVLGPSVGGCCYEVPPVMQTAACAAIPELRAQTTWGTPSLDLRAGCRAVLEHSGVASIDLVGGCTLEDRAWYSYRREATTGRFAGVVRLLP